MCARRGTLRTTWHKTPKTKAPTLEASTLRPRRIQPWPRTRGPWTIPWTFAGHCGTVEHFSKLSWGKSGNVLGPGTFKLIQRLANGDLVWRFRRASELRSSSPDLRFFVGDLRPHATRSIQAAHRGPVTEDLDHNGRPRPRGAAGRLLSRYCLQYIYMTLQSIQVQCHVETAAASSSRWNKFSNFTFDWLPRILRPSGEENPEARVALRAPPDPVVVVLLGVVVGDS